MNLDSRDGDFIPSITSESWVQVIDSNGKIVLSGKLIGTENIQDSNPQTPTGDNPPVSTTNVIIPFGAKDKDVSEFYVPSSISVRLSETVTWTNEDDADHTVTSTAGIFNSGVFEPGQSFSNQFSENGNFQYFCQLHPWMTGTVIAGEGGNVPTPPEPTPPPSDPPLPPGEPTETQNQNDSSQLIISPLKQMQNGILPKDIQCKEGFSLILRISNDVGACVHPSSLPIIVQRGWGT